MKDIISLIRLRQHVKNLLIFSPLFFAGQIFDSNLLINTFIAFIAFSLSASAIYVINDCQDIEEDRQHPKKKTRPIASGSFASYPSPSILLISIFLIVGVSVMATLSLKAVAILGIYIILNLGYSFHLKHIALVDITIIAVGFVLRLFVGSTVTGIPISMWMVIMTFLLALFMALAKRRDDVLIFLYTGIKMRKVLDGYNLQFIDGAMITMASVVIVSYILYATSTVSVEHPQNEYVYLTTLFVVLGILRYLQIAFVEEDSSSPTNIFFNDKFLQVTILSWVFSFVWIIYL